ncbi:Ig domain-containing protein [Streptomyces sp. NPDC046876]|uniref:Ig domain-containing protein n=1 Tax=Streptomyces sp. NPDC046876 TaxID=3155616 RepID=UPI0033DD214E
MRTPARVPRRLAVLALGLTAALALPAGPAAATAPAATTPAATTPGAAAPPAAAVVAAAPTVASPGDQVSYQYDSVRIQVTATGGTGSYSWSAVNLPTGARIDPATGVISGTLRGAGTRTVTVTATDAAGASGSAVFTWRVIRDACPRC